MITKKDKAEAEAYCAEHPPEDFGNDEISQRMKADYDLRQRITELEGKIARAKDHLESSKIHGLLRGNLGFIDAALKELE